MSLDVCKERIWKNLCKMMTVDYWFKARLPHHADENVGCWASRTNAAHVPLISMSPHHLDSQLRGLAQRPGQEGRGQSVPSRGLGQHSLQWAAPARRGTEAWPWIHVGHGGSSHLPQSYQGWPMTVNFCPVPPPLPSLQVFDPSKYSALWTPS